MSDGTHIRRWRHTHTREQGQLVHGIGVLQCAVAVCCSVLQCVAVCCSVLQCRNDGTHVHMSKVSMFWVYVCTSVLQCVVLVCCSVLQCVAVCCSAGIMAHSHT